MTPNGDTDHPADADCTRRGGPERGARLQRRHRQRRRRRHRTTRPTRAAPIVMDSTELADCGDGIDNDGDGRGGLPGGSGLPLQRRPLGALHLPRRATTAWTTTLDEVDRLPGGSRAARAPRISGKRGSAGCDNGDRRRFRHLQRLPPGSRVPLGRRPDRDPGLQRYLLDNDFDFAARTIPADGGCRRRERRERAARLQRRHRQRRRHLCRLPGGPGLRRRGRFTDERVRVSLACDDGLRRRRRRSRGLPGSTRAATTPRMADEHSPSPALRQRPGRRLGHPGGLARGSRSAIRPHGS